MKRRGRSGFQACPAASWEASTTVPYCGAPGVLGANTRRIHWQWHREPRGLDTNGGGSTMSWEMVDEGWGRRAVDFATLFEPANCREYVGVHNRLGIGDGDRLLDVACG